jgi:flagellar biosynthesis chaperone FliJ
MKPSILILTSICIITSCNSGRNRSNMMMENSVGLDKAIVSNPSSSESFSDKKAGYTEVVKKKIIKDGRIGLRTNDLGTTKSLIDTLVRKYKGYYAHEGFNNNDYETSYDLNIRIPGANFEKFIEQIEKGKTEILYKELEARDVTDKYIDLETRLADKRNYLKQYNDLLKQAKSIKDILEIEEKIRVLEEEIDSTTGQLKYLNDQVDFSTLDLNISKRKEYKYNPGTRDKFSERLKQSLSKGWYGFVDFIIFLLRLWPFWILLASGIVIWKRFKKTKKK